MVVGDGGWFLENFALEFYEMAWACYYHPYASTHETNLQMDVKFSGYGKNNFLLYVFLFPIVITRFLVVFQDNKENGW